MAANTNYVGSATVRLVPSAAGFGALVERELRAQIRPVEIPVRVNSAGLVADIHSAVVEAGKLAPHIDVHVNTEKIIRDIHTAVEVAARTSRSRVSVGVEPDRASLRRFGGTVTSTLRTVMMGFVGGLASGIGEYLGLRLMGRTFGKINIEVDVSNIEERIRAAVAAASSNTINLDIDRTGLMEQIRAAVRDAEYSLRPIKIHIDSTALIREIHRAIEIAGLTSKLHVRTDTDNNGISRLSVAGIVAGSAALGMALRNMMSSSTAASGAMGGLSTTIGSVGWATLAAAAAVMVLMPALLSLAAAATYVIGGALGSLPGLLAGITAGAGTLVIGMIGLGSAFKRAFGGEGSAGGKATRSVNALANAERALARAERELLSARNAVNQAYVDAKERIEDLGRALNGARIDEEAGVLAVRDARIALTEAQANGDIDEVRRARVALKQAKQNLAETRDQIDDLSKEKTKADKTGVAGSDEVVQARERELNATESLAAAQEALADAQKGTSGGGGGGAKPGLFDKIAPSAQAFVDTIKSLKPAFDSLRLDIQQRLFANIGNELRALAQAWMPQLKRSLGGFADTFNGIFRTLFQTWRQPRFIADMAAGFEHVRRMVGQIGQAVAGPLQQAFATLSRAAGPFIDALGDVLAGGIEKFAAWIERLNKSGGLDQFFRKAAEVFRDLMGIVKDLGLIFGGFMAALFQTSDKRGGILAPWKDFKALLDWLARWFQDPKNQQRIRDAWAVLAGGMLAVVEGIKKLYAWFQDPKNQEKIQGWLQTIKDFAKWLMEDGLPSIKSIVGIVEKLFETIGTLWDIFTLNTDGLVLTFARLPGRIAAALAVLPSILNAIGFNAITGFLLGFTRAKIAQTVTNSVAVQPTARVTKHLGIRSPSKVYEAIGANVSLGYLRGIQRGLTSNPLAENLAAPTIGLGPVSTSAYTQVPNLEPPTVLVEIGGKTVEDATARVITRNPVLVAKAASLGTSARNYAKGGR